MNLKNKKNYKKRVNRVLILHKMQRSYSFSCTLIMDSRKNKLNLMSLDCLRNVSIGRHLNKYPKSTSNYRVKVSIMHLLVNLIDAINLVQLVHKTKNHTIQAISIRALTMRTLLLNNLK